MIAGLRPRLIFIPIFLLFLGLEGVAAGQGFLDASILLEGVRSPSMGVGSDGTVFVSYFRDGDPGEVRLAQKKIQGLSDRTGPWPSEPIGSAAGLFSSILVTDTHLFVCFEGGGEAKGLNLWIRNRQTGESRREVIEKGEPPCSLAIDGGGTLHVSYADLGRKGIRYLARSPAGVWEPVVEVAGAKETGALLKSDRTPPAHNAGPWNSLAADPDGTVHLIYYQAGFGNLVYVKRLPLTRDFRPGVTVDGVGKDHPDVGAFNQIALDRLGRLHTCYWDATNKRFKHASNDGRRWAAEFLIPDLSQEIVGTPLAVTGSCSIAVLGNDIWIGFIYKYADTSGPERSVLYTAHKTLDSSSWTYTAVAQGGVCMPGPSSQALLLDPRGFVHVTYSYEIDESCPSGAGGMDEIRYAVAVLPKEVSVEEGGSGGGEGGEEGGGGAEIGNSPSLSPQGSEGVPEGASIQPFIEEMLPPPNNEEEKRIQQEVIHGGKSPGLLPGGGGCSCNLCR